MLAGLVCSIGSDVVKFIGRLIKHQEIFTVN